MELNLPTPIAVALVGPRTAALRCGICSADWEVETVEAFDHLGMAQAVHASATSHECPLWAVIATGLFRQKVRMN